MKTPQNRVCALIFMQLAIKLATASTEPLIDQTCDPALEGQDCVHYPYQQCSGGDSPICIHKNIFPVLTTEIIAMVLLPPMMATAAVSGVGGGGIFTPIAIGLLLFPVKEAIAMSTVIVFETAILRFVFFSAWKPHPERDFATEIDYNTVRVVFPLFLVGSFAGVYLTIAISELLLTILIITVLGTLSIQTLLKSRQLY